MRWFMSCLLLFCFSCGSETDSLDWSTDTPDASLTDESLKLMAATAPDLLRAGSGRCLDNAYGSSANGNKIQEWDCLGNSNQTWYQKNGYIISDIGGKCLDDAYGNTANGTKIQIWDCTTGNQAQIFNYTGGQIVLAKATNKCLDVTGSSTADGTKIQLYDCNGTNAQQWTFVDGQYRSGLDNNKCLDVAGSTNANGTQVQLYTCNGSSAQKWTPTNMAVVSPTGKCLDVAGASSTNGTKVQLYDCNGSNAQQWSFWRNDVKALGKCLDISNSGTANGTQVQIWDCDGGTFAQNWYSAQGPAPAAPLASKPSGVNGYCRVGGSCARSQYMSADQAPYYGHTGTDFATYAGNSIQALCNGSIANVITSSDVGQKLVVVKYSNCGGYPVLYGYYGHSDVASGLKSGSPVSRNQTIGSVANWSSNTHLHFGLSTRYITSHWGYENTSISTPNSCSYDNTRRDAVLNKVDSSGSGNWIDSYSFARSYNWWGSAVSVGSCN